MFRSMISVSFLSMMLGLAELARAVEPIGQPPVSHPKDNLPTEEKIALGKQLYFDGRLSAIETMQNSWKKPLKFLQILGPGSSCI